MPMPCHDGCFKTYIPLKRGDMETEGRGTLYTATERGDAIVAALI